MPMAKRLFTSESVTEGHPDKIADQISDAILDSLIGQDKKSRVAVETLITTGQVHVAGEVTTDAYADVTGIIRETVLNIGYDSSVKGFDGNSCGVSVSIGQQSQDIAQGVDDAYENRVASSADPLDLQGAGDQGLMFGYACNDTENHMPAPVFYSHRIVEVLSILRKQGTIPWLGPDAKSQVTVEYDDNNKVARIDKVVCSTQHDSTVHIDTVREQVREIVTKTLPEGLIDKNTVFLINPTGRFVIGGPDGDTGLTGRKIIVDTYGGMSPHGGGAFSGKDPTKVDRSAAYMARYLAKNLVSSGKCDWASIQLSYAIGVEEPTSIYVESDRDRRDLTKWILDNVDLTPKGIIDRFDLFSPIYSSTTNYGHFGKSWLPWEQVNLFEEPSKTKKTK